MEITYQELSQRGVNRLIEHNQQMLALCRETGDEANAGVYEQFLASFEAHKEHLPFFGLLLEGMLMEENQEGLPFGKPLDGILNEGDNEQHKPG